MSAHDDDPPAPPRREPPSRGACSTTRRLCGAEPSAAWALGLLRGAEPYRAPAGRKQRVQLRLGHTPRRRAPLLLRLAVMAFVLCGVAAIVSAALGHWPDWMARAYERVVGAPPAGAAPRRTPRAGARASPQRGAAAPRRRRAERRPPSPAEVARAVAAPRRRTTPSRRRGARAAAARAARHRPARTRRRCRRRCARCASSATRCARAACSRAISPSTRTATLAEEALAMSIEAAIAHHDADVAALAESLPTPLPARIVSGPRATGARRAVVAQPSRRYTQCRERTRCDSREGLIR